MIILVSKSYKTDNKIWNNRHQTNSKSKIFYNMVDIKTVIKKDIRVVIK